MLKNLAEKCIFSPLHQIVRQKRNQLVTNMSKRSLIYSIICMQLINMHS